MKVAKSIEDVQRLAGEILGMQLKTTRPAPRARRSVASTSGTAPTSKKEYYVSIVTDRASQKVAVIASSEGGMDIEEVAQHPGEDHQGWSTR